MALQIDDYGSGALGDATQVISTVNSYARVTAISATSITINTANQTTGTATFKVNAKILLHVSAATGKDYKKYLGKWLIANVTAMQSNVLTLDKDPTKIIPISELSKYYVQAVAIAQYKNLTLSTGTIITPPIYNASSYHGGIVAIMCSDTLKFAGGSISLTDRGIPATSKTLRPLLKQESSGTLDVDTYSGWENYCAETFPLNSGDGAAFIITKKLVCTDTSRIGNVSSYGSQYHRGATDSVGSKPSKVTNIGGSSIFIAAETIENFQIKMLAKYRSSDSTT